MGPVSREISLLRFIVSSSPIATACDGVSRVGCIAGASELVDRSWRSGRGASVQLLQKVVKRRTTSRTAKTDPRRLELEGALIRRTKRSSKVHGWPSFGNYSRGRARP